MSKRIKKCDLKLQTLLQVINNRVLHPYQQFLLTLYIQQLIPFVYKDCWVEYLEREKEESINLTKHYVNIGLYSRGGFTHCTLSIIELSIRNLPGVKILWRCMSIRQKAHNVIAIQQMFYDQNIEATHIYYSALDCIFTCPTRSQIVFIVSDGHGHTGYDLVIYENIGDETTVDMLRLCEGNRRVVFVNNY